jgi:hypothetical protein
MAETNNMRGMTIPSIRVKVEGTFTPPARKYLIYIQSPGGKPAAYVEIVDGEFVPFVDDNQPAPPDETANLLVHFIREYQELKKKEGARQ